MPLVGDGRSGTFSATPGLYGGYQRGADSVPHPTQSGLSRIVSPPPAPVVLSNGLEGTSGTAVSTANSGGPDQFDVVNVSGTGSTHTYDSAHSHGIGSTSAKMTLAAGVASTAYVRWSQTRLTAAGVGTLYCRFYIYLTAYPTATPTRLINGSNGANHTGNLQLLTDGTLRLFDSGGTAIATSTATVPLNQWVRIDFEHTNTVGTTADVIARMYSGANLETFTADTGATLTGTGMSTGGPIQQISFGPSATVTQTAAWTVWVDDVAISTVAAPGGIADGGVTVTPDLASSTPTAFDPTATTAVTVTPGLASSTPATYSPALTATVTVVPDVASSTPATYAPTITATVTAVPGLASATPTAYAPAVGATVTASPDVASSTPTAYAPVITLAGGPTTVVPDLASSTPTAHLPTVGGSVTAAPGVASSSPTAYAPAVTLAGADTYHPHVYVSAVLASNGVSTATLALSAGTAVLTPPSGFGEAFGEAFGGWVTSVTATLEPVVPATAALTGDAVSTATLTSNGVGTATVSEVPALSELQLV